jgi:hypothetical protein
MSKSHESYAVQQEDYRADIDAYFSAALSTMSEDDRKWYEDNDFVFTNNLHLRFVGVDINGIEHNPYYQEEYWPLILKFRDEHPDLWNDIRKITLQRKAMNELGFEAFKELSPEELQRLLAEDKAQLREFEALKNETLNILAPQLLKANINPLKLCI